MLTLAVTLAAGLGAVCRYLVDRAVGHDRFPWSTVLINVSGSFLLGLLAGAAGHDLLAVAGTGFAGGFTTLSTLAWETVLLAEHGRPRAAAGNVALSFGAGLLAAAAGLAIG
ncbi:MAG: CrcB protein [Frankiales bacterium]|nr:CrcB protein [Frankiales bacterium]